MVRLALFVVAVALGTYYAIRAPFYALLFYLGNAYFRPENWVWGDFVESLRLSLIVGLFVVGYTVLSGKRFVWNGRVALLWSFLLVSLLSSVFSEYSAYSTQYVEEFIRVIVITYFIIVLTTDFTKFRLIVLTIVFALGLEQAKQGWFYLLTSPGGANNNPVAFLGDNNGTAVGMLMLVPFIGFLMQTTPNRLAKRFFGVLLIGVLYRALSTYSRGGFLAGIGMGTVWWLRSRQKSRNAIGIITVLAIILPTLPDAFWKRMGTIQTYQEDQDESAVSRVHYWSVAITMAEANPVLGVGFNSYNKAYDSYDVSGGSYGKGRSVHNSFLGVLAELGYVGFVLYMFILWGAFSACNQVRRLASRNEVLLDFGKGASALQTSLVAFVIGGFFVPSQYNEMLWHIMGLSIVLRRIAIQQQAQVLSTESVVKRSPSPSRNPFAA